MTHTYSSAIRPSLERAKNIDHTPDITSDEYWDKHHIAVVRVTDVIPAEPNRPEVKHRVEIQISEAPIERERTMPLRHWWFGSHAEAAPPVAAGDAFVVFYRREGRSAVAALPLETSPEQSPLVKRLQRIARLRKGEGGLPALADAAFDADRDVALYSLKRLQKQRTLNQYPAFLERVRKLRDAEQADPEIRMLATRLLGAAAGTEISDEEYVWLQAALSNARTHDWTRLRGFALRLLEFPAKRAQTAEFLTKLVKDTAKPQEVRIAAYSVFEDPRLFDPDRMDAALTLVFDTVAWMVQAPDEFLRQAGSMLLHNLSHKLPPKQRVLYVERARKTLEAALAIEKSPVSVQIMKRSLDLLSKQEDAP